MSTYNLKNTILKSALLIIFAFTVAKCGPSLPIPETDSGIKASVKDGKIGDQDADLTKQVELKPDEKLTFSFVVQNGSVDPTHQKVEIVGVKQVAQGSEDKDVEPAGAIVAKLGDKPTVGKDSLSYTVTVSRGNDNDVEGTVNIKVTNKNPKAGDKLDKAQTVKAVTIKTIQAD